MPTIAAPVPNSCFVDLENGSEIFLKALKTVAIPFAAFKEKPTVRP